MLKPFACLTSRLLIFAALSMLPLSLLAQETTPDFSEYYEQIYQIRVSSSRAGSKSSIGSGFQVSAGGLIATNYHVISDYIQSPEQNVVQYRSYSGEIGELEVLDFDVVNDLALLRIEKPAEKYFELVPPAPIGTLAEKGGLLFAIGNPRDFGVTLVQGFNNGLVAHSYNDQLLFSGSLNPGMSGGPALDPHGRVFGVNVATAGSQLSFLIPAAKLAALIEAKRTVLPTNYQDEIAAQVKAWQQPRLQELIDSEWPVETFSERDVFGEIRNDIQCWGDSNESNPNRTQDWVTKSCQAANEIYLSGQLSIGQFSFSFTEQKPIKLGAFQFVRSLSPAMSADNNSNFENSTNFECVVDFIDSDDASQYYRISTCVRAHKKLTGLFDGLLAVEKIGSQSAYLAHLSVSGAEQNQLQALNAKFTERVL